MEKQDDNNGLAAGKVVFLGVEGAGKSCLTTALVHYFSVHADRGWTLRPENKAAFAFSVRQPAKFAAGERPMQTANFHHLRWSLCYRETPCRTLDVLCWIIRAKFIGWPSLIQTTTLTRRAFGRDRRRTWTRSVN